MAQRTFPTPSHLNGQGTLDRMRCDGEIVGVYQLSLIRSDDATSYQLLVTALDPLTFESSDRCACLFLCVSNSVSKLMIKWYSQFPAQKLAYSTISVYVSGRPSGLTVTQEDTLSFSNTALVVTGRLLTNIYFNSTF